MALPNIAPAPAAKAYVVLLPDGRPKAFLLEGINSNIPTGAIQITQDVYARLKANYATLIYDPATGQISPYVAPQPSKDALIAYASSKRQRIAASGIVVNIAPAGQPAQNVKVATQTQNNVDYTALYVLAAQNPAFTTTWVDDVLGSIVINATQIATIANAAAAFRQATFAALGTVIGEINAGTITTTAQVESFAWPVG